MSIVKVLGAVVVAILLVAAVAIGGDLVYQAGAPEQTAQSTAPAPKTVAADTGAKEEAAAPAATEQAAAEDTPPKVRIAGLIGDPDAGKKVSRQCAACHTFDEGGPNRVGPNLWNVVGRDVASHEGFNYSDAVKGIGGQWDLENLDAWLHDPKGFAAGNKMTFNGVKGDDDRANLIAYLQTLQPEDEIGKLGPRDEAAPVEEGGDAAAPAEDGAATEQAPTDAAPAEAAPTEAAGESTSG